MKIAEDLYGEPLGGILSAVYLRFEPGYLQIPYLQIHTALAVTIITRPFLDL